MNVEPWDPERHMPLVHAWEAARGIPLSIDRSVFPSTGLVVNRTHLGFVYLTNSSVCIFDQFLSDPACEPEKKAPAMRELVRGLTALARSNGATIVWMATAAQRILEAGDDEGFLQDVLSYKFACRRV